MNEAMKDPERRWLGPPYSHADMRFAIALVRNAREQLDADGFTTTSCPTENVLADMLEQMLPPWFVEEDARKGER